jgi:hypothetical protein
MALTSVVALLALTFGVASFILAGQALAANPTCVTPAGSVLTVTTMLHVIWVLGGFISVIAIMSAIRTRRRALRLAPAAQHAATMLGAVSILALVCLMCSYPWYEAMSFGSCIG